MTDDFDAVHIRADNAEERNRMRGSKYIQSKLGDIFRNVKADLDVRRNVLFSGTSCQVAGLKKYLGKEYDNLFCVDIVCHGVPSKKIWEAYLRWQEQKMHSKVASVDFRNKKDLTPEFLDVLEDGFKEFFEKEVQSNPLKAEYLIPIFIGELLEQGKMSVKVLKTNDTWYGMTYHEDVATVKESFKKMLENGVYKADLFSDL